MEMTSLTKHTPTPWEASEGYIFKGKKCIVNCETEAVSPRAEAANAAFIARAVNTHDEMVTALQQCRDELGSIHHARADVDHAEKHSAGFRLANAALAKLGA